MCVIIITFNIHSSFNLFQLAWAPAVRISGSTTIDSFGDCFPWHWIIKKIVAKVIYILINDLIAQQKARHYVHFQLLFVLFTQINNNNNNNNNNCVLLKEYKVEQEPSFFFLLLILLFPFWFLSFVKNIEVKVNS